MGLRRWMAKWLSGSVQMINVTRSILSAHPTSDINRRASDYAASWLAVSSLLIASYVKIANKCWTRMANLSVRRGKCQEKKDMGIAWYYFYCFIIKLTTQHSNILQVRALNEYNHEYASLNQTVSIVVPSLLRAIKWFRIYKIWLLPQHEIWSC